ncbi:NAD(P)H-quinone oxidoreductase subunit J [Sphingobium chlorophenolicum L-1]|uniref:NADH-quinone oxidoreductase subunit C n=1 Tax=Sphingobium chlorophenolicum L-1 TaxID=690566 RepID=F6EVN8_SPHCR|nr:NADH-quinone oxidoreductase subunit C [Sphingobium chlorophenolicum]AEG48874.1 NAD(P)H-quinone oxidoreductase subunit J [Sphingobium chlorophenolicum L-1]
MGHSAPRIATIDGIAQEIAGLLGSMLVETVDHADELSFTVVREKLADALAALRDKAQYQQLMEIAGVDYPERPERFEVCYHLLSVTRNHRIRVKVSTDEDRPVPTVTHLWPVAGWLEREVFDMYGVIFEGNADLRRILTDYGFKGHPQRKDFPLTGYVELRYSEEDKRVVYEPVKLAQDFRSFDFMSPWEGAQYVLPGDEKAPQAPGAPSAAPASPPPPAAPKGEPKADTPKTTDKPGVSGAGEPTDSEANKKSEDKA